MPLHLLIAQRFNLVSANGVITHVHQTYTHALTTLSDTQFTMLCVSLILDKQSA